MRVGRGGQVRRGGVQGWDGLSGQGWTGEVRVGVDMASQDWDGMAWCWRGMSERWEEGRMVGLAGSVRWGLVRLGWVRLVSCGLDRIGGGQAGPECQVVKGRGG